MYSSSITAIISAVRTLFSNRRSLLLMVVVYTGLLAAIYLFVSTREATVSQLMPTFVTVIVASALFFVLQAAIVSNGPGLVKTSFKLLAVTAPVIALTVVAMYGLNKVQTHSTIVTTVRYILLAVISPLLVIQLWITVSNGGMRVRSVLTRTFAPQSMFVYAFGFLIFAVVPYLLLQKTFSIQRSWLEISVLLMRLALSALLIFLGWVTTVRALSILSPNRT